MEIHPIEDGIPYDSYAGDVYTLNTAGITLTAGTLTYAKLSHTSASVAGVGAVALSSTGSASGDHSVAIGPSAAATGEESLSLCCKLGSLVTVSAANAIGLGYDFENAVADCLMVGFSRENFRVDTDGVLATGELESAGFAGALGEGGGSAPRFLSLVGGAGGADIADPGSVGGKGADGYITAGIGGASVNGAGGSGGDLYVRAGGPGVGGASTGAYGNIYIGVDADGDVYLGDNTVLYVPWKITHKGDANTGLWFENDRVKLYAGNILMFDIYETTNDYFEINPGNANVDTIINGGSANTLVVDGANNNVSINATTLSANYDLALLGDGVLCLAETTTPTADADKGKVYTKNDNTLYFQDGAGVEHTVSAQPGTSGAIVQVVNDTDGTEIDCESLFILNYDNGSTEPSPGDEIDGQGTGHGHLAQVVLSTGAWDGSAAGYFILYDHTGAYVNNEQLDINGGAANIALANGVEAANPIPQDNTKPQISEGREVLSATLTPASTSNKLLITAIVYGYNTTGAASTIALFDGNNDALATGYHYDISTGGRHLKIQHLVSSAPGSETTYTIRADGILTGKAAAGDTYGGTLESSITIMEIAA